MTDESGDPVERLEPGTYEIHVSDLSSIHNLHLLGPGVEGTTTVPEIVTTTWTVTFEEGECAFVCDPRPPMEGRFTIASCLPCGTVAPDGSGTVDVRFTPRSGTGVDPATTSRAGPVLPGDRPPG